MISWKLSVDFNKQKHLFFQKLHMNYIIETYLCSCGCKEFIIKYPNQKINYTCKKCKNKIFYNANEAYSFSKYLKQHSSKLTFQYDIKYSLNTISSSYITYIPTDIDFMANKIIFSKKIVYTITLNKNGTINEIYLIQFPQKIKNILEQNLISFIEKNNIFNIPKHNSKLTLSKIQFFLKNPHLKECEFYYWSDVNYLKYKNITIKEALAMISNYPKTKSVKKAVYQNYISQMQTYKSYNPLFVKPFCKTIKDTNILVDLLNLDFDVSKFKLDSESIEIFILFLKQYYSEKQILKLFKESINYAIYIEDTIFELLFNINNMNQHFQKVPCKIITIHDEFVRCQSVIQYEKIKDKTLSYTQQELQACKSIDKYEVKLPRNGNELYIWANRLHNCMASYFFSIKAHKTIIYGFFQNSILQFVVEISDGKIIQSSSKNNNKLSAIEEKVLSNWYNLYYNSFIAK